ncbi:MFS transporter [Janibacter anophelis]|uniref:MFS transporter n=1 Tax=Janibacter anophelis TaxID=319054 RepID=UPI000DEED8FE|nr:MFS transporter [Janibacter anophelis]
MSVSEERPSRADRLGRLPYTRRHTRLLVGSGTGWALDAMDVGLISFVIVVLAEQWQLSTSERSWIVTVGFIGMAIGATLGGRLADRFGRRAVFAATLVVYGLATGASALVGGLAVFLVLRFLVGLGLGAELPVASTLVSELSPTRIRGRLVVLLESFWAVGWILAAVIGFYVVPRGDDGWRWGLALGLVPAVYAVVVRFGLPESAAWLESRGRHAEAEEVVRGFEESAGVAAGTTTKGESAPFATAEPGQAEADPTEPPGLWSAGLRRRTLGIWLVWFGVNFSYYGAFLWIPSLLVARGHDVTTSFGYTLVITLAQLPGYALAALLVEVWGRRGTLALFLVGSAVAAWFFGQSDSATSIIVAGSALSFCNLGAWGALYAITPEIYPTRVRGAGAGAAAGFGRLASIAAPLTVPFLLERGGDDGDVVVFSLFTAAFVLAAAAAFLLPETRGRELA